ncbi:polysaccharide biosynthesis protein [Lactiplantibacillus plantarum]|nr:polysaccharide biosynthesis protein [Lactiplantibacillus plantarum]
MKMRKRLAIVWGSLALLALLLGYACYALSIQRGQDTVTRIYQTDQNGTPIISPGPITLVGKVNHRNLFQSGINGYVLTNRDPLATLLPRRNQTVHLKYRSAQTTVELRKTLRQARYLQAGTQNTATPVFQNRQQRGDATTYGRISTSQDGRIWTKLPISYPHVQLSRPSVWYANGRLTLIDGQDRYWTTNFKDWQHQRLNFNGADFKQGRVQAVFPGTTRSAVVVVRGIDRQSSRAKLYYGQLTKTGRVKAWHALQLGKLPARQVAGMSLIDQHLYLFRQRGTQLAVYRANRLTRPVRLVGRVKLNHAQSQRVTAVNLIPTTKHRYRLIFDLTTAEKVQKQPRYRLLDRRFKAVGQQHLLIFGLRKRHVQGCQQPV